MSSLEKNVKISNGLSAANLFVSYKSLKSLNDIKATQERNAEALNQLQHIQREQLQVAEAALSEARKQSLLLERQEEERKLASYERDRQKQLRDLVFRMNEEIEEIQQTSSSFAETYFRAKALNAALDQSAIVADDFNEIGDKVFWSGLGKALRSMLQIKASSGDVDLERFIKAVDRLFELSPPTRPDEPKFDRDIEEIKKEDEILKRFIALFDQTGEPLQKYVPDEVPDIVKRKSRVVTVGNEQKDRGTLKFHLNSDRKVLGLQIAGWLIILFLPLVAGGVALATGNVAPLKKMPVAFYVLWGVLAFVGLYILSSSSDGVLKKEYREWCQEALRENSLQLSRFEKSKEEEREFERRTREYNAEFAAAVDGVGAFEEIYSFLRGKLKW